jgi:DNA-binding NtrC family response regulator
MVNVMIIDDDDKLRNTLTEILVDQGYSVKGFDNGKDAIDASFKELFNVALIDISLPDMDGTKLLTKLKKNEPPTIRVIMTGNATLDNSIEAANRGVDAFLVKPFQPAKLIDLLETKLAEQKQKFQIDDKRVGEYLAQRSGWMSEVGAPKLKKKN